MVGAGSDVGFGGFEGGGLGDQEEGMGGGLMGCMKGLEEQDDACDV